MGTSMRQGEEGGKSKNKNITLRESKLFELTWFPSIATLAHNFRVHENANNSARRTPRLLNTTSVSPKRANLAAED